ncbi:DUF5667 domain-containing protein [Streptomyces sp. NBC_00690]|uniref:DUF5667 domain-containing protein n=1 Tax=Streptomyces sp. NBC_00690 TaxID=2975808 RepID=UPI002E2E0AA2|nr:DUF5667 domain-containing protein [Streptomyces sp. NBC_00690]
MIANVSAHRRANAFAQALEDQVAEQPDESVESTDQGRLLALATGLGELPRPEMDPEVKVVQRAQLVAAMEAMLQEGTAAGSATMGPTVPEQRRAGRGAHRASPLRKLRPRSRWSKGLAAGGLTVTVAAGAFGGVAAASTDALPGDTLYGLKRGMEDIRLGMADGETDRGEVYLDQASTRLSEARRLMERGRAGELDHESLGEVRRALNGMRHDATEGHRLLHAAYARDGSLRPIQKLNSFSRAHRDAWNGLRDRLPVQLTDVGNEVNHVFDAIDQEVGPLQSLLPSPPEQGGRDAPRTSSTSPQAPGRSPAPGGQKAPAASQAPDTSTGAEKSDPRPSGGSTPAQKEDGLLGGDVGGLLDPTPDNTPPPAPGKNTPAPEPDVTIPPLLPGILPGLGLNAEEGR